MTSYMSSVVFAGKTHIPAPHGQLEAIWRPTRDDAERVALILHPHPSFGGTMHNPVVFHCAKALAAAGFETLRINFRGVGESTGSYDEGRGEIDDARVALDFLLEAQPQARDVLVAGYSFGAAIALKFGCAEPRVRRIVVIAAPFASVGPGVLSRCAKPKLFVHGTNDDLAPLAPLQEALRSTAAPPASLHVIEGAGHFFENEHDELAAAIEQFAANP